METYMCNYNQLFSFSVFSSEGSVNNVDLVYSISSATSTSRLEVLCIIFYTFFQDPHKYQNMQESQTLSASY